MLTWAQMNQTFHLRLFGLLKIPLIAHVRPVVEQLDAQSCRLRIPLGRRSKNHLGAMYFGALCVGADITGGLIAMDLIRKRKLPVSLVFKDFTARFLKRAEGDVVFTTDAGEELLRLVERAASSDERVEKTVPIKATCPDRLGDEPVAEFSLTISLKRLPASAS